MAVEIATLKAALKRANQKWMDEQDLRVRAEQAVKDYKNIIYQLQSRINLLEKNDKLSRRTCMGRTISAF